MTTPTDHALVIREADKTDIPVIGRLAHAIWPDTYGNILGEAQLHHMLDLFYAPSALEQQFDASHHFVMAELNSEPVGFASYSHAGQAGVYKIHKLYVHPLTQGKGLGRSLLDTIIKAITNLGAITVQLNVNRYNPAKSFYEKHGFRIAGQEDIAIGEGYFMNDYVMEKSLQQ